MYQIDKNVTVSKHLLTEKHQCALIECWTLLVCVYIVYFVLYLSCFRGLLVCTFSSTLNLLFGCKKFIVRGKKINKTMDWTAKDYFSCSGYWSK